MMIPGSRLPPGDEKVYIVRQHPIVLFLPALLNLAAVCLITALSLYLKRFWFLVFYIVPLTGFFLEFLSWLKKKYILTDRRIVKMEGLLATSLSEISLDAIHEIVHHRSLPGRMLQYGKIVLRVSGMKHPVIFHLVPKPDEFKNHIIHLQKACRHKTTFDS